LQLGDVAFRCPIGAHAFFDIADRVHHLGEQDHLFSYLGDDSIDHLFGGLGGPGDE
jgi:hypothetical protein